MKEVFKDIIDDIKSAKCLAEYARIPATAKNAVRVAYERAIDIVSQAAAEYNNGWIPVSERLPEEYEDVEVTVEEIADDVGGKRYYNVRTWLQDGQWVIKKNPYHPTVIAWRYPGEPYQPNGE